MRIDHNMIAPQATVSFRWILNGLEVIRDRNNRKQNQNEDGKSDRLREAASTPRGRA
jgi:hypothetical protein